MSATRALAVIALLCLIPTLPLHADSYRPRRPAVIPTDLHRPPVFPAATFAQIDDREPTGFALTMERDWLPPVPVWIFADSFVVTGWKGRRAPVRPIRLTLDPLRGAWLPAELLAAERLWIVARVEGKDVLHVIGREKLGQLRLAFWDCEATIFVEEPFGDDPVPHSLVDPALLKPTARHNVFVRERRLRRIRVEVADNAAAIDPPPTIAVVLRNAAGDEIARLPGITDPSRPIRVAAFADRRVTLEVTDSPGGPTRMRRGQDNRWVLDTGPQPPTTPSGVRLTLTDAGTPCPVGLRVDFRRIVDEETRFGYTVERLVRLTPDAAPVALLPPGRWKVLSAEVVGVDEYWSELLPPRREFVVHPGEIAELSLSPMPPHKDAFPLQTLRDVVVDLRVGGLAAGEAISGRLSGHLIDGFADLGLWGATADDPQLRPLTPDPAARADSPWPGMRPGDPADRSLSGVRLTDALYLLRFESPRVRWTLMNWGAGRTATEQPAPGLEVIDAVTIDADRWHGVLTLAPAAARHELGTYDAPAPVRAMNGAATVAVDPPGDAPEWLAEASVVDPVIGVAPRSGRLVIGPQRIPGERGVSRLHVAATATRPAVMLLAVTIPREPDRDNEPSEVGSVTVSLPGRTPGIFAHIWDEAGTRYTVDLARVPRERPEPVEFPVATGRVYAMLSTSRDGEECAALMANRREGGDWMNGIWDPPPFVQFMNSYRDEADLPDLRRVFLATEPTPVATPRVALVPTAPHNESDGWAWRSAELRHGETPGPVWVPVGRYLLSRSVRPSADDDRLSIFSDVTEILIPRGRGPLVIDLARW
jgi:hypothetical protein